VVHHRVHAYVDPPTNVYKRPRTTTDLCREVEPASAAAEAAAIARVPQARARAAPALRRVWGSPSEAGTARSSPSLQPDEMSDDFDEDEEPELMQVVRISGLDDTDGAARHDTEGDGQAPDQDGPRSDVITTRLEAEDEAVDIRGVREHC
jgi:hypothetical protein